MVKLQWSVEGEHWGCVARVGGAGRKVQMVQEVQKAKKSGQLPGGGQGAWCEVLGQDLTLMRWRVGGVRSWKGAGLGAKKW